MVLSTRILMDTEQFAVFAQTVVNFLEDKLEDKCFSGLYKKSV